MIYMSHYPKISSFLNKCFVVFYIKNYSLILILSDNVNELKTNSTPVHFNGWNNMQLIELLTCDKLFACDLYHITPVWLALHLCQIFLLSMCHTYEKCIENFVLALK